VFPAGERRALNRSPTRPSLTGPSVQSFALNATKSGHAAFVCWWFEADLVLGGVESGGGAGGVFIDSDPFGKFANSNRQQHWGQACTAVVVDKGAARREAELKASAQDEALVGEGRAAARRVARLEAAAAQAMGLPHKQQPARRAVRGGATEGAKARADPSRGGSASRGRPGAAAFDSGPGDVRKLFVPAGARMILTVGFDATSRWPVPLFELALP
jgi:hypothetical protein